ncbi:MAG TPA: hypothetical protein VG937_26880 [Polyangiaceae bacterium]|nr:hypothetical protein [Polyangiaceae bacterium]
MKTRVDLRLREEATHFRLSFTCEACAHFAEESGLCGNGYPNQAHRAVEARAAFEASGELTFCKEFELR